MKRRSFLVTLASLFGSWCTRSARADFIAGEPPISPNATTIVVLPDTQNYSESFPDTFRAQTLWIAEQRERRNIPFALHLGDITNNNSRREWEVAQSAMNILDGQVPYIMAVGNHDYGPSGDCTSRDTLFNEFFPVNKLAGLPTFGEVYDKEPDRLDNSYHRVEAAGRKWLIVSLEFGPREDVVRWANEVVSKHQDRSVILITHAFVYHDGTRYNWKTKGKSQKWNPHDYGVAKLDGGVTDGEDLWRELLSKHDNIALVVNGHVLGDGLGFLVSDVHGNEVPQMLVNFQMKENGGNGWLRLLEIQPDGRTIKVIDYSPTLDLQNTSPENHFEFQLPAPPVESA
jgi:hypothetical protein